MRLLYLTAGAAEMYCGTCLRDNALAAALLRRGHDVVLAPIYTPTTTDEVNVSGPKVLFGGVSVFLEQHVPLFRHTPAFLDWVWDSTPVLKLASKRQIKVDRMYRTSLPGVFAVGDVCDFEGKIKLIATGVGEVTTAVCEIKQMLDPTAKLFPGHSSDMKQFS